MTDSRTAAIGIVTVSDRAARGEYEDRSGPTIAGYLDEILTTPYELHRRLVPDQREKIEATLCELTDQVGCDLVLTSGGTGPAPRDTTPEATEAVCAKLLPGFGEQMRRVSLGEVATAILSRQTAGIRGRSLIINLPGSPRAIRTCLDAVFAAVPEAVDLLGGARLDTDPARLRSVRLHPPSLARG